MNAIILHWSIIEIIVCAVGAYLKLKVMNEIKKLE